MTQSQHTPGPEFYAPNKDDVRSKSISYAYPSSPRAEYFNVSAEGCYFIVFNGENAHTGPFGTIEEAENFADSKYPDAEYGHWSMRSEKAKELWRAAIQKAEA